MKKKVNLYQSQYSLHQKEVYQKIRTETFGTDIGQNSWITAKEQDEFIKWLILGSGKDLLDIACGSGETTLRIAELSGCRVTGVDIEAEGIETANQLTKKKNLDKQAHFIHLDGNEPLPFGEAHFDAVTCIDAINHLKDRKAVLNEWYKLLKPGGMLLFTDPITVTGILTKEEIQKRSTVGYFLFSVPEANKKLLSEVGFTLLKEEDHTSNTALTARAWTEVRKKYKEDLIKFEGSETYKGKQEFLDTCATLAGEKRLSRMVYLAQKPI